MAGRGENMSGKVVFTVGSVLRGDDAAGPMLAKMMEENPIPGWEVIDGGQMPEDELSVVRRKNPDVMLVVDAADMGLPVGSLHVLDEDEVVSDFMVTTHSLPITYLLGELRKCCGTVVFLGIQPGHSEFFGALSPEVMDAVQKIYDFLSKKIDFADLDASISTPSEDDDATGEA